MHYGLGCQLKLLYVMLMLLLLLWLLLNKMSILEWCTQVCSHVDCLQMTGLQETSPAQKDISAVIESLKKQVAADRSVFIKVCCYLTLDNIWSYNFDITLLGLVVVNLLFFFLFFNHQKRMEENRLKMVGVTNHLFNLSNERSSRTNNTDRSIDLLTKRQKDAIDMHNSVDASNGDGDSSSSQEDDHACTAVLLGSNVPVKNAVRPIKLVELKRLPPYTTWIFLDRCVKISFYFILFIFLVLRKTCSPMLIIYIFTKYFNHLLI